ncbi:signal recognition particle-docking protein FtsY [Flavobacteriales bacterium]|jgi:fused signal recognition particle receptor|nr:signal recognition particle-docking protein FtsY [Flavobacteriales bacterium]MDC0854230.1 signal recognition particle-docking protein FtsY [Flavobacteriales bacterium]
MSFFKRIFSGKKKESLDSGLEKTRTNVFQRLAKVFTGRRKVDEELMDDLEEALITADVGVDTSNKILDRLRKRARFEAYMEVQELYEMLREEIAGLFSESGTRTLDDFDKGILDSSQGPKVIMVVGVNGVGKTTSIGKLAWRYKNEGKKVLLGASDTFRAAAIDQLKIWSERAGVEIIAQHMGADPASVAFDTLEAAVARDTEVVIVDTAGRLHNKKGLMEELTKIKRVMDKIVPGAPHEVLLVLDGSTGQNAVEQAKQFMAATEVSGLVLTKLDGTAKGGAVLAISDQLSIPVRFIGIGEKMEDLQDFDVIEFIDSLLPENWDESTTA